MPLPAASAPGTSTRTATGPPSTPMACADTPTHVWPCRRISSRNVDELRVGVDAATHVQPLDEDGAAGVSGVRGAPHDRRVSGSRRSAPGSNVHSPSAASSPAAEYDDAVPAATYSCSS